MIILISLVWTCLGEISESQVPFECTSYLCPSYLKENDECDFNCMSQACNFDSSDEISTEYFPRFLNSGCLSKCLDSKCTIDLLQNSECDNECDSQECGFDLGKCGYCASGCTQELLLNNKPDEVCNSSLCMYDNNEYGWCAPGCFKEDLDSSTINSNCNNADCEYQEMKIITSFCAPGCSPKMQENGFCDNECNNPDCDYDNWDCTCNEGCTETLLSDKNKCHSECNNEDCGFQNGVCGSCASGCFEVNLGDQICDDKCNNENCDYDYGDCSCAPGCKNYFNVKTGKWANISPDPCDPYCLVEDCLFNYEICFEGLLIKAALFYAVQVDDPEAVFEISDCTTNSECTLQLLNDSDTSGVNNEKCESSECLYSMGLKSKSSYCTRTKPGPTTICYLCRSDYIQVYTSCFEKKGCEQGFKNINELDSIFGTTVCLKEPGYSKGVYYEIEVNDTADEEALGYAFQYATRKYNKIVISPGNYTFGKIKSSNYLFTDVFNPLYSSPDLHIKEIIIEGADQLNRPTIFMKAENSFIRFYTLAETLVFRYVNFDGSKSLIDDCEDSLCMYCPYYSEEYTNVYVNDRSKKIDPTNYGKDCEAYSDFNFIQIDSGKELIMEEVDVNYFQQQFNSFIYSEGKVSLVNVSFNKIQASKGGVFISIKTSTGSFEYKSGTVSNLNYGYEYRTDIVQSGFLKAEASGDISLTGITFTNNFVMIGLDQSLTSALIKFSYLKGTASITDCEIKNSLVYNLINFDSSYSVYTDFSIDKYGYILEYHDSHLVLEGILFENLAVLNCVICVEMDDIIQNVEIKDCEFKNIFESGSGVISVNNAGTFGDTEISGSWGYVTIDDKLELGFFDARTVEIVNCTFESIYFSKYLIAVVSHPNVVLQGIQISDCSQSDVEELMEQIINSNLAVDTYLTQTISSDYLSIEVCSHLLYFNGLYKIDISNVSIEKNNCQDGSVLLIKESVEATISKLSIYTITVYSEYELILIESVDDLSIYNLVLNEISKETDIVKITDVDTVSLSLISANTLSSTYLSSFNVEKVLTLTVTDFYCYYCVSTKGNGGGISVIPNTAATTLTFSNFTCEKCEANNGYGAGIGIDSYTVNTQHLITLTDLTFIDCSANDGTILTLSFRLTLNDSSSITGVKVSNCVSNQGGIIIDGHQTGKLSISDYYSINTKGFFSFIQGTYSSTGETLSLSNITIINSYSRKSVISVSSTNFLTKVTLNDFQLINNTLETTDTQAIQAETLILTMNNIIIDSGSGILAKLNSNLFISNLKITNLNGVGIYLSVNSYLICEFCDFSDSIDGSAVKVENNSSFIIRNSNFNNLHTSLSPVALVVLCNDTYSYFYNCIFISTTANEVQSYSFELLWGRFKIYDSKFYYYESDFSSCVFRCLECHLMLENCEFNNFGDQIVRLIDVSSDGEVRFKSSEFTNGLAEKAGFISIISSTMYLQNSTFINCINKNTNEGAIQAIASSNLYISESNFILSSSTNAGINIYFTGQNLEIDHSKFSIDTTSVSFRTIYLGYGTNFSLKYSTLTGSKIIGIKSDYQENISIYKTDFIDLYKALDLLGWGKTKEYSIIDSQFINSGYINSGANGGAIHLTSTKTKIQNCTFYNNRAENGGGIYFTSSLAINKFNIINSTFELNEANSTGGALYWNNFEPTITNSEFKNNSAPYGGKIASVPKKISLSYKESRCLSNSVQCAPGAECKDLIITVYLLDTEDEIFNAEVTNTVQLSTKETNYSIAGATRMTSTNGIFQFKTLTFSGEPGTNFTVIISTSSIDASNTINDDRYSTDTEISYIISLRDCVYGEQKSATSCTLCSSGSYLIEPSSSCNDCISGAQCKGGAKLLPLYGYWKSFNYSEVLYKCPLEEACLGYVESDDYTGSCANGYTGKKCSICIDGYTKTGANKCGKCPSNVSNGIILFFLILCSIIYCGILVRSTLKSAYSPKSLHSIYIKIFTNYIQLVFLMTQFELEWPSYVNDFFQVQRTVATAYDQVYSYDCIFENSGLTREEIYYFKLVFNSLLALIVWGLSFFFFAILSLVKKNMNFISEDFYVSMTVLFFLIYPDVVRVSYSAFSCTEIDGEGYWLTDNLIIKCWNSTHMKYSLIVALPSILIWSLGVPGLVLLTMYKRRNYLNKHFNKIVFGFLFNGYKSSKFYWEFLIMFRKILIICIAVFMQSFAEEIQALTLVLILLISLYLQYEYKPYNKRQLNHMEFEAILTASVTIYCGLYYLTDDIIDGFKTVLFIIIVFGNAYFIIYWVYYMVQTILEILSEFIPVIKKITGKLDPYPDIVYNEPYVRQGVYQEADDEDLKYTILPKYPKETDRLVLPGIKSMNDLLIKVVERQIDADEKAKSEDEEEEDGNYSEVFKKKKFNTVNKLDD